VEDNTALPSDDDPDAPEIIADLLAATYAKEGDDPNQRAGV
jgi:hypothetical protein